MLSAQQGLIFLTIEWIVYFFIAIYLDNILPNESGVSRRWGLCGTAVQKWLCNVAVQQLLCSAAVLVIAQMRA